MNANSHRGHMGRLLCEGPFHAMLGEFSSWRIDSYIRQMEASRKRGRILAFVRGLRLSAHVIYTVRDILSGTGLTADWGHILDKSGDFVSSECDVIIHCDGYLMKWNGKNEPVMDFRFIEPQHAVVVISCKSYLTSSSIDKEYPKLMQRFVNKVWLFAECCGPRSADSIRKKASSLGYERFWHLYNWSKHTEIVPNSDGWISFVDEVKKLA